MNRKIVNIQALRGVAALMVLVAHLHHYEGEHGAHVPGGMFWVLGNAGVDLFFVISGFVMVTVSSGRFGREREAPRFLIRRAARIYPLYWCFSLVILPLYLLRPGMVNAGGGNQKIILWRSFLLYPQQAPPLIAQGWTLSHELYFYLVFACLLMLSESWLLPLCVLWGALVSFGSVKLDMSIPTINVIANPLTLEFIAGCFIAVAARRGLPRWGLPILLGGSALLVIGGLHTTELGTAWQRDLYFGIPAVLIVLGSVAMESRGSTAPRWLIVSGDASYSLYLSQGLILAAIARTAWKVLPAGIGSNAIILAAMAIAAVIGGFCCYFLLELPLIGMTKKLLARKKERAAPVPAST